MKLPCQYHRVIGFSYNDLSKVVLSCAMVTLVSLPALAQAASQGQNNQAGSATKPVINDDEQASVPMRLLSVCTGLAFGTPIAILRKSVQGVFNVTKYMAGDSDNPLIIGAYGLAFGLPFGTCSGTVDGVCFSFRNSWHYSDVKPFGKESFSLGDLD